MNCDETRALFDDYAAGALPDAADVAIDTHMRHCRDCRAAVADELRLRVALRTLVAPQPRPGFAARALRAARRTNRAGLLSARQRWFGVGFASAMAATVAVWSGLMVLGPHTPVAAKLNLALNQVRTVGLVIDSPEDIAGVEVSMLVPENVELIGYPGRRHLSWTTHLQKGRNVLSVPVIATGEGDNEMRVSLFHDRKTRSFRVQFGVTGEQRSEGPRHGAALG